MATKSSPNKSLTILFWLLHISLLALLFMPMPAISGSLPNVDKLVHVLLFIPVSIVTYLYLGGSKLPILIGLSFYAFLIEVGQDLYTNTRSFEWMDWFLGTIGIVLGWMILSSFTFFRK